MVATFRTIKFSEIVAAAQDGQESAEDFDYIFSDSQRLKTKRALLYEALDAADTGE